MGRPRIGFLTGATPGRGLDAQGYRGVRFTRHARNRMRRLGLSPDDVEGILREPLDRDADPDGRSRYVGWCRGRRIRVVVAVDSRDLVVTVHERS